MMIVRRVLLTIIFAPHGYSIPIQVVNEAQLRSNLQSGAVIELIADIALTSSAGRAS
jgi:hypothetical protein